MFFHKHVNETSGRTRVSVSPPSVSLETLNAASLLCRVEREIQQLRRRISEGEGSNRSHSTGNDGVQSLNALLPLSDDRYALLQVQVRRLLPRRLLGSNWCVCVLFRINAYIEEEVQRRLRKMNLLNGSSSDMDLSLSCESLRVRTDPPASLLRGL